MKRYLIFGAEEYAAQGGWRDLVDSFDMLPLAIQRARRSLYVGKRGRNDWADVVDTQTGDIVHELLRKDDRILVKGFDGKWV